MLLAAVVTAAAATAATAAWAGTALAWQVLLVTGAGGVAVVAADPRDVWSSVDRRVAAPATVLLAGWSAAALTVLGAGEGTVLPLLAASLVASAACLVAVALHRRDDERAVLVEVAAAGLAVVVLGVTLAQALDGTIEAWPVLLTLAAGALVLTTLPSRRQVGWVALVLGTTAFWERLGAADVGLVEAWTLPPAAVLAAVAVRAVRTGRDPLRPTAIGAALLVVLPSTAAAVTGTAWRPGALLVVAVLTLGVARLIPRRPGDTGRHDRRLVVLLVASSAASVVGVWSRALPASGPQVELWALGSAAVLGAAALVAVTRGRGVVAPSLLEWVPVPVVVSALLPSVLAPGASGEGAGQVLPLARHLAVMAAAGAVLVLCVLLDRLPWARPTRWSALAVLAVAGVSGLVRPLPGTVEVVTVAVGVVLVVVGWVALRVRPDAGSWPWLGSGLVIGLVPTLALALTVDEPLRGVLLAVVAGALLAAGAVLAWQAPVVVSSAVLLVYALSQAVVVFEAAPRWASLAVVGAALLALGARYERRLRDLGQLGRRVAAMR